MPKLEQFEIKKYWQIFSGLKPVESKLTHDQVQPILFNSKLDSSVLNKIWFLADIDDDDNLDFEEFVICMRLIFDMVNKNIDTVPDDLPDWLIPGSKAKLNAQRKSQADSPEISAGRSASSADDRGENTVHKDTAPTPELDWYISPSNKSLYGSIYESCDKLTDGTVAYGPLSTVVRSNFPNASSAEIDRMWALVNPRNSSSINKDPAVYLIHALKQNHDFGCELPTELPHAIRDICNQQRVSYDLNSSQADVKRASPQNRASDIHVTTKKNDTNNTAAKDSDGEVAQLRRQLASINAGSHDAESSTIVAGSDPSVARKQFEELYNYRQSQVLNAQHSSRAPLDVRGITEDLETIEQQVGVLEQFLANKKQELYQLQAESQSFRA